ncbi:MAG: cell division protein FtsZ [Bacteroidales bacterium]|nr:cell division protein FtsZ [Bacteroidales bacterium]
MLEDLIDFNLPKNSQSIITVIGVGGGGNNAVNRMYEQGINDVEFVVVNTDAQALSLSQVPVKIQIGETLTEGRGAGNRADVGEQAAIENIDNIRESISNGVRMVFVVAGMGGGTGTGAAPIVSQACRDMGILTVAVVTLPFRFEGPMRLKQAVQGINRLKDSVDALLVIHNEKLREIYGNLTLTNAFGNADSVLMLAVKGIAEIITLHGYINVDFADVISVMTDGGIAFMGSAEAAGHDRAKDVIEQTINSPLLNNNDIRGAKMVLLNITSGVDEITVDEIGIITDTIMEKVGGKVNTIWGTCTDETLGDMIRITLVATGFDYSSVTEFISHKTQEVTVVPLGKNNTQAPQEIVKLDDSNIDSEAILDEDPVQSLESLDEEEKPFDPYAEENELRRINAERLKELNYTNMSDSGRVDQMEREPAFKRKQMHVQTEIFPEQEEKSRYTIGANSNGLRPNNTYLHDAVD